MKLNYLSRNHLTLKRIPFPDMDTIDICIFSIKNFSYLSDSVNILSAQEQKKVLLLLRKKTGSALLEAAFFCAES